MFWDAATCRKIITKKNLKDPLNVTEIFAATRIKYKVDPETKRTVPAPKRYRKQWLLILNSIGENECRYK